MFKKLSTLALAATLLVSSVGVVTSEAEARSRLGVGIAAGVLAGSLFGAYAYGGPLYRGPAYYAYSSGYSYGASCYKGPRQCDWAGRSCWHNRYGDRVCSGGEWRCWRPTVCD